MPIMNPEATQEKPMPQEGAVAPRGQDPMMEEDDGVDDEEYGADIMANLEAHLNSLPDEQKAFLSEYATTPEGATMLGIVNGKEVYDYFAKYIDPSKSLTVTKATQQPSPAQGQQPPAQPQPQQPAPQAQPQAAPQGQVMRM
jgi:hypothetical protein